MHSSLTLRLAAPGFAGYTSLMAVPPNNLTFVEAIQTVVAFFVVGVCVLSSGYLLTILLAIEEWRIRGWRALWSAALGIPFAVGLSVWGQRLLPRTGVNVGFALLSVVALSVLLSRTVPSWLHLRKTGRHARSLVFLCAALAVLPLYCLFETIDIQVGHRLFLSTLITDWSPRVAMIGGAMRSGVPPLNGLSTLSAEGLGFAPHLRYYYFWFVFLAEIAAPLRLQPQAVLTASCIWAGWGFLASCFLSLRYMLNLRQCSAQAAVLFLALLCVLGLDILPTGLMWLSRNYHPLLEMEWWRADRTPSFLGMLLASPHHLAAFCSLLCGTLLLFLSSQSPDKSGEPDQEAGPSTATTAFAMAVTGLFFAVASGLALFPTLCFAFGLSFWAVDLVRRKRWRAIASLAGAGGIALLLAHSYLTELSSGSSAAKGLLVFAWRSDSFAGLELTRFAHLGSQRPLTGFLLRLPAVAMLDFMEFGFYVFVFGAAIRNELLRPGRLSAGRCLWWSLLLGAAVPAFFLSSVATNGPNDLGFDSGFLLRLCLQLWAVGWLRLHWARRHAPRTLWGDVGLVSALALAILGLSAQLYQVLSIRLYFPLVGSGRAHKQMDVLTRNHLSNRLYNIYVALQQFDREVPPSHPDTEAIQFNPIGVLLPPQVYFNTHQIASWDTGCGTSFGGEYGRCGPIFQSLLFLYGNTEQGVLRSRAQNTLQDAGANRVATATDLAAVCRQLRLRAVVADATDSIWAHPDSWVWTGPVLVANSTVRIISCPAGSWRP